MEIELTKEQVSRICIKKRNQKDDMKEDES